MEVSPFPWLYYHQDHHILICRRCQQGIRNPSLNIHLRDLHKDINLSQRRQIILFYQSFPLILSDNFHLPLRPVSRVSGVQFFSDGLKCREDGCSYICRKRQTMQSHLATQHQWENPCSREGSLQQRRKLICPWQTDVPCQRLFTSGKRPNYFEILPETDKEVDLDFPNTKDGVDTARPQVAKGISPERILNQLSAIEASQGRDTIIQVGNETEANP